MYKYLALLALISCVFAGDNTLMQWIGQWVVTDASGSDQVACVLPEVGSFVTIKQQYTCSVDYYYYNNGSETKCGFALIWTRNTTYGLVSEGLPWTAYYEPDYTPQPSNDYVPAGTCFFTSSNLLSCAPNVGQSHWTIGNTFQNYTGLPSEINWSQGDITCNVSLIQYY